MSYPPASMAGLAPSAASLCLFTCRHFHPEVLAAIAAEGWSDVTAQAFPSRCGRPAIRWTELQALLPAGCSQVIVLGRSCLAELGTPPADFPPVSVLNQQQCFDLVAPPDLVAAAIAEGAYLLSPGWLADWPAQLQRLGLSTDSASEFFHDFARELLLLDTGISAEAPQQLAALQAALGLPARRLAVGLTPMRQGLNRLIQAWRREQIQQQAKVQERQQAAERADAALSMEFLARLAQVQHETEAIGTMEELFRMLFAPAVWRYVRVERGQAHPAEQATAPERDELNQALMALTAPYAWTPSGQGFMLRLSHGEHLLGRLAVEGLAFPEFRSRYLNQALSMVGVCALAIANARAHQQLLAAEKMAALGIMVAGVAHEINTPVGVSLTAASTLQEQTRRLKQSFAERRMTQSDLHTYLERAATSADLILGNLARIGQLIDSFRQVAVTGLPLNRQPFRFRTLLADIITSLGERLSGGDYRVQIECDDTLEIESFPGDWVSILTNLITNSLRHGFKNRPQGQISITVTQESDGLILDYRDDGLGLSEDAQYRIFDPFFTTDLQQGMGLGMHLVYNLVTHRLGGHIQCAPPSGRGVHFHIEVPL